MTYTARYIIPTTQKQWNIIALASTPTDPIGYAGAVYYPDHDVVAASDRFLVAAFVRDGDVPTGLLTHELGTVIAIPRDVIAWVKRELVGTRNNKCDLVLEIDDEAGTMTASVGLNVGAPSFTHQLEVAKAPGLLSLVVPADPDADIGSNLGFTAKTFKKLTAMTQGEMLFIHATDGRSLRTDLHDTAICFTRANRQS